MGARTLGERVRRLRLVAGLGQVEFAERVGIATGSVSKLENGQTAVSESLLDVIGRVLNCSPRFLLAPVELVPSSRPWLRAYADAPKRSVDRQLAEAMLVMEVVDLLGLRTIPDIVPTFSGDLSDDDDIEQFAADVRAAAQIDDGEVVGNTIRAAERLGCIVLPMREELGRHLGLSTRSNLTPVISVSRPSNDPERHVPGDRQRFTVSHELGHLALHAALGPPQTAEEATRVERQAHLFAGAFLAPGDAILAHLSEHGSRVTLTTLAQLKGHWGIAIKSLVVRFRHLGVIDADQARSLYKQISARGWNKQEPVHVGNESAVWLLQAIKKHSPSAGDPIEAAATDAGLGRNYVDRWVDWSATSAVGSPASIVSLNLGGSPERAPSRDALGTVTPLPVRGR